MICSRMRVGRALMTTIRDGEVDRLLDRMRDQHHRLAFGLRAPAAAGPASRVRVCASSAPNGSSISRNCGLHRVGARERQPLAHAARQHLRPRVGEVGEAHQRHVAVADRVALGGRRAVRRELQAERDVLPRTVSHGKTPYSWKITPRSGPGPATGLPSSSTRPGVGFTKPRDDVHHRRLAAARRADDRRRTRRRGSRTRRRRRRASARARGRELDRHAVEDDADARSAPTRVDVRLLAAASLMRSGPARRRGGASTARSTRSIASAIRPMQMMPT